MQQINTKDEEIQFWRVPVDKHDDRFSHTFIPIQVETVNCQIIS